MFFIFFFHFSDEKLSSFLFSCISFKYVLLLALVSEFNCFLRSRCSMEMWCPDDIGRDSWDWVGPPAWRRACFNSPEWGGGSSPVKTEPLQIVLLLLLLLLFWLWLWLWFVLVVWLLVPPDPPPPDRPKKFAFCLFRLPPQFHSFCLSLCVFSWNFGGVCEDRDPQM